MLKEAIAKFGVVSEVDLKENEKESYVIQLSGLDQEEAVYIEVVVDNNDLISIGNSGYPIAITKEKVEYLDSLFDEEYTISRDNGKYTFEVKTKGVYFPTVYLEDIKSFYDKFIEKFGEL